MLDIAQFANKIASCSWFNSNNLSVPQAPGFDDIGLLIGFLYGRQLALPVHDQAGKTEAQA